MPYMKFRNWYVPNCDIAFPTEEEAWEYLAEMEQEQLQLLATNGMLVK